MLRDFFATKGVANPLTIWFLLIWNLIRGLFLAATYGF